MKSYVVLAAAAAAFFTCVPTLVRAEAQPVSLVYETPREFFGGADFNGDGLRGRGHR